MTSSHFSLLFLAFLFAGILLRTWLSVRHASHIRTHHDQVPTAFTESISLEAHQKAADYTLAKINTGYVDLGLGVIWVLILTLGGGLNYLNELASTIRVGNWINPVIAQGIILFGLAALIGFFYDLPMTLYRIFVLEARFGFNKMTPGMFLKDTLMQGLLAIVIGVPLLWAVLWFMQSTGYFWWVWTWVLFMTFSLSAMIIYPLFIAPLFNKFEPLKDESLKTRVEALLTRCGFRSKGLFVMDGSKRSAHGNAYFTGFGAGKRIVFFDTLLSSLTPEEIEAVLAHELGHFKHHHIWKRLVTMSITTLLFLALLGYLVEQNWFYQGLGVYAKSNALALMLFSMVLSIFTFPLTPLNSMWSRKHEFEADTYAKQNANAQDLISALVKLYRDNASTLTPDPLHSLFYDSHPPASIRIAHLQEK